MTHSPQKLANIQCLEHKTKTDYIKNFKGHTCKYNENQWTYCSIVKYYSIVN